MDRMNELKPGGRVAYFGGSFDPPHLGHLAVARAAQAALGLDAVLFAPTGTQPLKSEGPTASFEDRVAMTRLALQGEPGMSVSLADAPRPAGEPNYSAETLTRLRAELPPGSTLYFLMGADSFLSLRHWRRAAEIPFLARLIVAARPGQRLDDLGIALPGGLAIEPAAIARETGGIEVRCYSITNVAGQKAPLYLLPGLNADISASDIRDQICAGKGRLTGDLLLPAAVANYVRERELYQ